MEPSALHVAEESEAAGLGWATSLRGRLPKLDSLLKFLEVSHSLGLDHFLGPPVVPFLTPCCGEGCPTKTDYRKKGTLILASLLKDLGSGT